MVACSCARKVHLEAAKQHWDPTTVYDGGAHVDGNNYGDDDDDGDGDRDGNSDGDGGGGGDGDDIDDDIDINIDIDIGIVVVAVVVVVVVVVVITHTRTRTLQVPARGGQSTGTFRPGQRHRADVSRPNRNHWPLRWAGRHRPQAAADT